MSGHPQGVPYSANIVLLVGQDVLVDTPRACPTVLILCYLLTRTC